jgi:hypothetical protein
MPTLLAFDVNYWLLQEIVVVSVSCDIRRERERERERVSECRWCTINNSRIIQGVCVFSSASCYFTRSSLHLQVLHETSHVVRSVAPKLNLSQTEFRWAVRVTTIPYPVKPILVPMFVVVVFVELWWALLYIALPPKSQPMISLERKVDNCLLKKNEKKKLVSMSKGDWLFQFSNSLTSPLRETEESDQVDMHLVTLLE